MTVKNCESCRFFGNTAGPDGSTGTDDDIARYRRGSGVYEYPGRCQIRLPSFVEAAAFQDRTAWSARRTHSGSGCDLHQPHPQES